MIEKLIYVFEKEKEALKILLNLLEQQHEYLTKEDVFALDAIVKKIENANKDVASLEMERRSITGEQSIREIVKNFGNENLDLLYREIQHLLHELKTQKDSNDILIRQGLGFTTQILDFINPSGKTPKTYNSYGKVKR
ncbi:FlgN protein [Hathewaya proteolytica DSM 3090]|uniref:FlgN protein n=1 Tax=Hathewaya proteolytica DSM 3090 TaxID=1121331 RepID=A0A1M6LBW5_9CLOT|nr:flagellar protein FlgN [Hathewaya proteolytica]SHJ68668.1 FlgN protein [Hathewaya proteolytica DSM 3090]